MRLSIPVLGLYAVCLTKPQSMTNTILSIVKEVSAMLVAKTTFRAFRGVGSNILDCISEGNPEYIGKTISSLTLLPKLFIRPFMLSIASSI